MEQKITSVFSCELRRQGIPAAKVATAAAEASRVAWCESRFRPDAVAFGGKYLSTPNPTTGKYYTAAGLFQFIRSSADRFIPGGYANAFDPTANTIGAASYWVYGYKRGSDPWGPWSCKPGSAAELKAAAERAIR